jgi:hypothetical protein
MTPQEKKFVDSISTKIKEYNIKTSIKEAFSNAKNTFTRVKYNDGTIELVDTGIEYFLCSKSPAYFIDKYCYISVPNLGVLPFSLYHFQKKVMEEINNYRKYVFLKTRQSGLSTVTAFYCLWRCLFRSSESIAVVSKKEDAAQDFIAKVKVSLDLLPDFLSLPITTQNLTRLIFSNHSQLKAEARSANAGRSATLSLLVLDEAAFYGTDQMIRNIVGSAQPTLSRTGGSLIIISTPNGTSGEGSYYFEQVNNLKLSGNTKDEKLVEIDWFEVPDFEHIYPKKGYNDVLNKYIKMDYFNNYEVRKEMRSFFHPIETKWKENAWLKEQYNTLGDVLYRQEILHDFVVMGSSVFSSEILERVNKNVKEPVMIDKIPSAQIRGLWIWKMPQPKHRYIFGVDCSKGSGNDSSAIEIIDVENYEQVAEYNAFVSTPEFSRIIKKLASFYNQAFVVIESNGIGESVFNGVYMDANDAYSNVYKQKINRNGISVMTGWITDVKTRQLITNTLVDYINVDELWETFKLYSSRVYTQLSTWIWSGGRIDHAENAHDDALIALSLALHLRDKAVNSGQSFIIAEDGKMVDYSVDDPLTSRTGNSKIEWDFITSEEESARETIEKQTGLPYDKYRWLISDDYKGNE